MGGLMPVGSGPDAEIISILNNLFSGKSLKALRGHKNRTGESLFDRFHKLRRLAFRLGVYPARDYSPDDAKRKWFYFLHHVLPQSTENTIKKILADAIDPNSPIKSVQFFVEENSKANTPHLFPSNNSPLSSFLDSTGKNYFVRLIVKAPMDDTGENPPDQIGDHDRDDNGNDVEHTITWPTFTLPKSKKKAKKHPGGAKKKAKKKKAKK